MNNNKLLISFSGAQSTGKTTLLNHLKERNDHVNFVPEVTRLVKREYGVDINECGCEMTQSLIITEHFKNIHKHKQQNKSTILDRCILDGVVYTDWLCKNKGVENWCKQYAMHVFNSYMSEYNIIFYTSPDDVKLENDGERSTDIEFRNDIIHGFSEWMSFIRRCWKKRISANVIINLSGTVDDRLQTIQETLKQKGLDIQI